MNGNDEKGSAVHVLFQMPPHITNETLTVMSQLLGIVVLLENVESVAMMRLLSISVLLFGLAIFRQPIQDVFLS